MDQKAKVRVQAERIAAAAKKIQRAAQQNQVEMIQKGATERDNEAAIKIQDVSRNQAAIRGGVSCANCEGAA